MLWNVRGLNDPSKCVLVRSFIRNCKCCVVCLQETKLASSSLAKLRSVCGFSLRDFRSLDALGSKGGLLTAWNPAVFDCLADWIGFYSLNVILKWKADNRMILISNIYGPSGGSPKDRFYRELLDLRGLAPDIWMALGDFNILFALQDKNGAPSNVSEILRFRGVMQELGLTDLPLLNRSYTWTNGRISPTLERLDRAFISPDWLASFPNTNLRARPRPRSDHTPLVVSASSFIPSASLFRFESYWLRYPACEKIISDTWNLGSTELDPLTRACEITTRTSTRPSSNYSTA